MNSDEYVNKAEQIKKQLYKTAYLYLASEKAAIDAVDEAVFKGFCSFKKLRNPEVFKTWMTRILINVCNTELMKKKREIATDSLPEDKYEDYDALPLKEAISKLPNELRLVIILRFYSGLTLEETAEALSLPRGTVTSRQKKALELLKLDLS